LKPSKDTKDNSIEKIIKHLRPLGVHSDDTQQALGLIHCIIKSINTEKEFLDIWGEFNVKCYKIDKLTGSKSWRDYGQNFSRALDSLVKGVSTKESGSDSDGIGAAMRCSPISCFF
jgi:ADP-ribosyl-[dinitrogen reductase] hydrolase